MSASTCGYYYNDEDLAGAEATKENFDTKGKVLLPLRNSFLRLNFEPQPTRAATDFGEKSLQDRTAKRKRVTTVVPAGLIRGLPSPGGKIAHNA